MKLSPKDVCALVFASITALATSVAQDLRSLSNGTYDVRSDCPGAQSEGTLALSSDPLGLRLGENAETFGFPSNQLQITSVKSGSNEGAPIISENSRRKCQGTSFTNADNHIIFVCFKNDSDIECTIHMKKISD